MNTSYTPFVGQQPTSPIKERIIEEVESPFKTDTNVIIDLSETNGQLHYDDDEDDYYSKNKGYSNGNKYANSYIKNKYDNEDKQTSNYNNKAENKYKNKYDNDDSEGDDNKNINNKINITNDEKNGYDYNNNSAQANNEITPFKNLMHSYSPCDLGNSNGTYGEPKKTKHSEELYNERFKIIEIYEYKEKPSKQVKVIPF